MIPIVDTHQHLWRLGRFPMPWLDGFAALRSDYPMSDYLSGTADSGVVATIYMEVDVASGVQQREAHFALQMCRSTDNPMAGAVIAGRPADPGFRDYIDGFGDERLIKGVRQVLWPPEIAQGTCLDAEFVAGLQHLGETGRSFDLCMRPSELGDAVRLAKRCPDTRFILDHCGFGDPMIVAGQANPRHGDPFGHERAQWLQDIAALGRCENVVCKLSGLVFRSPRDWTPELLAPTVNHCIESFGADRVVFGGNWPVCTLVAGVDEWIAALRTIIASRPQDEQRRILHDNAVRVYGLRDE